MEIKGLECCGGAELVGINDTLWTPKKYLLHYIDYYTLCNGGNGKGFVVISYAFDVHRKGDTFRSRKQGAARLKRWKKFVESNGLGTMSFMRTKPYNPNYGTKVRLQPGLWVPNNKAIAEYAVKQGWRKLGRFFSHGIDW